MKLSEQTYLVRQALTRLWSSDRRMEPSPDALAVINAAFWAQSAIGRALLRRYHESRFDVSTLVEAALEQSPESPDDLICRVFESFLDSLNKKDASHDKRGGRQRPPAKRKYKPRPAPPVPPMPPAPPTLSVTALCGFCKAPIKLPRSKEFVLCCYKCGLELHGINEGGEAQLTVVEASIPGIPGTLAEAYKVIGLPISTSVDAVKDAYRRKLKLAHPDRFHGRTAHLQEIAARLTLALNLAFEMIKSNSLASTA
jgi:hypothetical protein